MGGRWRDGLLLLLAGAVVVLAGLALRTPAPPTADVLRATTAPSIAPAPSSPASVPSRRVQATRGRPVPVVLLVGDSYVAGAGASRPDQSDYASLLAGTYGWDVHHVSSIGGGYAKNGAAGTVEDLLRAYDVVRLDPDLIVLQAGHNDVVQGQQKVQAAAGRAIALAERLAPRARLDVVGVLWPGRPPTGGAATDLALQRAATAAGAMFSATFDLRFPAAAGNRPTDEGHRLIAARLAASFQHLGLVAPSS